MPSTVPAHRAASLAIALLGALVAACAPERIPGSTVDQGDAGVSFVSARATAQGALASTGAAKSGASYGGGSSGSSLRSASSSGSTR